MPLWVAVVPPILGVLRSGARLSPGARPLRRERAPCDQGSSFPASPAAFLLPAAIPPLLGGGSWEAWEGLFPLFQQLELWFEPCAEQPMLLASFPSYPLENKSV